MYQTIVRLYAKTKSKEVVANAVKRGYITEDEYFSIVGEQYIA